MLPLLFVMLPAAALQAIECLRIQRMHKHMQDTVYA